MAVICPVLMPDPLSDPILPERITYVIYTDISKFPPMWGLTDSSIAAASIMPTT